MRFKIVHLRCFSKLVFPFGYFVKNANLDG